MMHFGVEKFKKLLLAGSFAMVVEFLMGLSDSIVAGNLLGENALAAINLLSPVMNGVTFFAGLCGVGMGINYALERGRCAARRSHEFFTQGLVTVLLGGAMLLLLFIPGRDLFLGFMAPGQEISSLASAYWNWYMPSAMLEPVVILLVNVAMADGDSRLCMGAYTVQLTVNFLYSYVSVRFLGLGIGGCSQGTSLANVAALLVLLVHFRRASNTFRLVRHFSLLDTLRILKSSIGDSCSFLCSAGLFFFLNKFVICSYGAGMLPVLSAVIVTIGFLEIFNGVGTALSPIVTVYVGELNSRAVRTMMAYATRLAVLEGVGLAALLAVFPSIVTRTVGIDDPGLVPAAELAVRLVSAGLVFYSLVYLYNSYYVFIAHEALAVAMTVVNGLIAPVALVAIFGRFGLTAVWEMLALAPFAAMLGFMVYLLARYGRKMFPLLLPRERDSRITMFDLLLEERAIATVAEKVANVLKAASVAPAVTMRASLMTEEVLMAVKDRNGSRRVLAEVTLDLNDGVRLTLRDDGEIFDITDADSRVNSLRTYLVASVMEHQKSRRNILTTGFNRNVFRF